MSSQSLYNPLERIDPLAERAWALADLLARSAELPATALCTARRARHGLRRLWRRHYCRITSRRPLHDGIAP